MRKIEAIIRKEKFADVFHALEKSGVGGITAIETKCGKPRSGLKDYIKLELYTDEFQTEKVIDIIRKAAKTGVAGDGKIALFSLEQLYSIRNNQQGASAI